MYGKTTFEHELESLAAVLIGRYPTGFSSEAEVGWPYAIVIRVIDDDRLETLRMIILGCYQKVRAFGTASQRTKDARIPFSSPVIAPATAEVI